MLKKALAREGECVYFIKGEGPAWGPRQLPSRDLPMARCDGKECICTRCGTKPVRPVRQGAFDSGRLLPASGSRTSPLH